MSRRRLLEPPIYLSGAQPPPLPQTVQLVAAKTRPIAGLLGATALGVTAAYFGPKFFDWALARWRASEIGGHGDEIELELDDDG